MVLNRNLFWTYNLRYSAFKSMDNYQVLEKLKLQSDPGQLSAYYNSYFDVIVVSDNQDIYLYRSDTGKATCLHENIFDEISVKTLTF